MHSLIIVDLQSGFEGSRFRPLRKPVLREIDLAKRNGWPIIVLEYDGCGKTSLYIRNALSDYPFKRYVTKHDDDGGREAADALNPLTRCLNVRVIGINTDFCVAKTVAKLIKLGYRVTVAEDACYSAWHLDGEDPNVPANIDWYNHYEGISLMVHKGAKIIHVRRGVDNA